MNYSTLPLVAVAVALLGVDDFNAPNLTPSPRPTPETAPNNRPESRVPGQWFAVALATGKRKGNPRPGGYSQGLPERGPEWHWQRHAGGVACGNRRATRAPWAQYARQAMPSDPALAQHICPHCRGAYLRAHAKAGAA